MSDDDLIRRALGGDETPELPSGGLVERAVSAGNARRRRRMWTAGAIAAGVLLIGGVALAVSSRDEVAVVGVDPTVVDPSPPPSSTSPALSAVVATSVSPIASTTSTSPLGGTTTSTSSTVAGSVLSTTTTVPVPSPTTLPSIDLRDSTLLPCPPDLVLDAASVVFATSGTLPAVQDSFFVTRGDDSGPVVELWTPGGRVASIRDTFPPDRYSCVNSVRPLEYDGRWMWSWIGVPDPWCGECGVPSVLIRSDVLTGETVVLWTSVASEPILDIRTGGDGGALIVSGPAKAKPFIAVERIGPGGSREIVRAWSVDHPTVIAASLSPNALRLAFTWADPPNGISELRVVDVVEDGDRRIDLSRHLKYPSVRSWSPTDARVIVDEHWEDIGSATIDVFAADPAATLRWAGTFSCWFADGDLAIATWDWGYGERPPTGGTIRIEGRDGQPLAEFGRDLLGGEITCLSGDRVAFVDSELRDGEIVVAQRSILVLSADAEPHSIVEPGLIGMEPASD
jgi:hypothetical protein